LKIVCFEKKKDFFEISFANGWYKGFTFLVSFPNGIKDLYF
jgi:hypothetical protein